MHLLCLLQGDRSLPEAYIGLTGEELPLERVVVLFGFGLFRVDQL